MVTVVALMLELSRVALMEEAGMPRDDAREFTGAVRADLRAEELADRAVSEATRLAVEVGEATSLRRRRRVEVEVEGTSMLKWNCTEVDPATCTVTHPLVSKLPDREERGELEEVVESTRVF